MERLTWEYKDGGMFVDGKEVKNFICDDESVCTGNAIIRLAAYEDLQEKCIELTGCGLEMLAMKLKEFEEDIVRMHAFDSIGLTPEEIKDILSVLSENQDDVDEDGISVGMINDLLELARYRQAEEQELLIKLPAPIGAEYTGICRQQVPTRTGWKTKSWLESGKVVGYTVVAEMTADKAGYNHQRDIAEIGEAWFIGENQKEAAEEALKGGVLG